MMLIEGLIAIFIFSMGILAIVGLQSVSVKQVSDASYRSQAAVLSNTLIGTMWVSDHTTATMQSNFNSPNGAGYIAWLANVSAALPQSSATVNVDSQNIVTVTVKWLAPSEVANTTKHQYVTVAQIR
ncbi:Type IV fimbrial biogenesis protein PilV [Collimonas arenae]|uniref:Type IV fimbrial biogenesis protein PilV n=2 Tax=Collimonas arenae TaxID=279058 RepID=A0A0A1FI26_9BURK|nr:Type IV fimbrial biogenesis protein PilV [Collimonas arenae]